MLSYFILNKEVEYMSVVEFLAGTCNIGSKCFSGIALKYEWVVLIEGK